MAFDRMSDADTSHGGRRSFRDVLGGAYVSPEQVVACRILSEEEQSALAAWVDAVIPGDEHWPSAAELNVVAYIDATLAVAAELRPTIRNALRELDHGAWRRHGRPLAECGASERTQLVDELRQHDAAEAFPLVLELTYEAYYRSPTINEIIRSRTGFDAEAPHRGSPMKAFDAAVLDDVADRPSAYREVR